MTPILRCLNYWRSEVHVKNSVTIKFPGMKNILYDQHVMTKPCQGKRFGALPHFGLTSIARRVYNRLALQDKPWLKYFKYIQMMHKYSNIG
jgi:hypothetical protein